MANYKIKKSIIILGPTAAGKTKLGVDLAKKIDGEIISADSMQVYRGMDIGTAKPTLEERQGIPHHLIDIRNPDEEWTVSDFVRECQMSKAKCQMKEKVPIIVGGTGLYLWTLLEGYLFPDASADKKIREQLEKIPAATLYAQLSEVDPEAAKKIHANNKKRIVRALEVYQLTGKPISELQKKKTARPPDHQTARLIGLTLPREILYQRISQRVDKMIGQGLIEEVKNLLAQGHAKDLPAFQALGYKEIIEYLTGKWTKEKMVEELKKRTRNFAKRQMTWFKRFKEVKWLEVPVDTKAILAYINNIWSA